MKFEGIIPPILTPLNEDHSIDEAGYATMIEYMIGAGVHAIIVGGTTGEYYAMTHEERIRQFHYAKDVIAGRVPMIAGVNDARTEDAAELAGAAKEAGADGILIAAPYYSLPTERELVSHCLMVDRAAGLPVMLYNYPGRTGVCMGEEFLERVGQNANFQCIKEASGDINRVHLLAREFPHIQLSCGCEDQALEFYVWGATSWVTPMGNFFIDEVIAFHNMCLHDHDFVKARKMMKALLPITSVLEGGGKYLQSVKFCAEFYGLPAGPVRKPLRPLKKEQRRELREVLNTAKTTMRRILSGADEAPAEEVPHVRLVDQG